MPGGCGVRRTKGCPSRRDWRLLSLDVQPVHAHNIAICPETLAGIMSYVNSREAREGMYALVDVGAWTTDISFVRVSDVAMEEEGVLNHGDLRRSHAPRGRRQIDEVTRELLD